MYKKYKCIYEYQTGRADYIWVYSRVKAKQAPKQWLSNVIELKKYPWATSLLPKFNYNRGIDKFSERWTCLLMPLFYRYFSLAAAWVSDDTYNVYVDVHTYQCPKIWMLRWLISL